MPATEQDQRGRDQEEEILVAHLREQRETGEAAEVVDSLAWGL